MTIIATLHRDGRTIAKGSSNSVALLAGAQGLYVTITFPELRTVEQVLGVEFRTQPKVWISTSSLPQDKTYVGKTVGISLMLNPAAGTTLTLDAVVIGN